MSLDLPLVPLVSLASLGADLAAPLLGASVVLDIFQALVMTLFVITALLLMLVILVQEGKGGGIAGAFGGAVGETFGVKAGSINRFTAILATVFVGLALIYAGIATNVQSSVIPPADPIPADGGLPGLPPGVPPGLPPGTPPAIPPATPPAIPPATTPTMAPDVPGPCPMAPDAPWIRMRRWTDRLPRRAPDGPGCPDGSGAHGAAPRSAGRTHGRADAADRARARPARTASGPVATRPMPSVVKSPRSMTGAGTAPSTRRPGGSRPRSRSVNHRFLKVSLHLSGAVSALEPAIEERTRAKVERGHVTIGIRFTRSSKAAAAAFQIDEAVATAAAKRLETLAKACGLAGGVTLKDVLTVPGVITDAGSEAVDAGLSKAALAALEGALDALVGLPREGGRPPRPGVPLDPRRASPRRRGSSRPAPPSSRASTATGSPRASPRSSTGSGVAPDPAQLAREVAGFADRCDVAEELARLDGPPRPRPRPARERRRRGAQARLPRSRSSTARRTRSAASPPTRR